MNSTDLGLVSRSLLAAAPYFIAGPMLLSGKWRISTAAAKKDDGKGTEPAAEPVPPSPSASGTVPASVSASAL